MATRTDAAKVIAVLGLGSQGGAYNDADSPDLVPFINAAYNVVTRVDACATRKGITLSSGELEILETWLAAHLYQMQDPGYKSRATAGASGAFDGGTEGEGFEGTRFGRTALNLDWSGCLKNLNKQQRAGAAWLGKAKSDQIPYDQRN